LDGYIPNYYNHVDINFQINEKEKHVDLKFYFKMLDRNSLSSIVCADNPIY
jgi:hypothetical protein